MDSVKHFCYSYEDKFKLLKIWKHVDWDIYFYQCSDYNEKCEWQGDLTSVRRH